MTLTAFPNPQLKVVRNGTELDFEGQAFLTGIWTYKGSDTIPSDKKKGCATYEEDMTYGSTLIPGIYDESKVGMTIKQLLNLKKGKSIVADGVARQEHRVAPADDLRLGLRQAQRVRGPQPVHVRQVPGRPG